MLPADVLTLSMLAGAFASLLVLAVLGLLLVFAGWRVTRCVKSVPLPVLHQSGRAGLSLLLCLSAALVAAFAACTPPPSDIPVVYDGHEAFLERAKAGW